MSDKIEVISPDSPGYAQLRKATAQGATRYDFTRFSKVYNDAPVESVLLAHYGSTVRNFCYGLETRGLVKGIDFDASKVTRDASGKTLPAGKRPIAVVKLTEKLATTQPE